MKKVILLIAVALVFTQCGINKQLDLAKNLEKCKYEITSADSIYIAHVNVGELRNMQKLDMARLPQLALALLRQNVPLQARINLQISNPSNKDAGVNQFEYKVLIKDQELANGYVNQKVMVSAGGGVVTVPVMINANVYQILSDPKMQQALSGFIGDAAADNKDKKSILTIKIKPTLDMFNKQIQYPGYITINKEITNKILL